MKNCFLRLFYDEIAKCSVHSNIFVKPKQCVSCLLVFWCFSPWFCKFSRLVCSVKCLYVESIFLSRQQCFYGFQSRLSPVSFGEFFKNFVQLFQQSQGKTYPNFKKSTDKFLRNRYSRISQKLIYKPAFKF